MSNASGWSISDSLSTRECTVVSEILGYVSEPREGTTPEGAFFRAYYRPVETMLGERGYTIDELDAADQEIARLLLATRAPAAFDSLVLALDGVITRLKALGQTYADIVEHLKPNGQGAVADLLAANGRAEDEEPDSEDHRVTEPEDEELELRAEAVDGLLTLVEPGADAKPPKGEHLVAGTYRRAHWLAHPLRFGDPELLICLLGLDMHATGRTLPGYDRREREMGQERAGRTWAVWYSAELSAHLCYFNRPAPCLMLVGHEPWDEGDAEDDSKFRVWQLQNEWLAGGGLLATFGALAFKRLQDDLDRALSQTMILEAEILDGVAAAEPLRGADFVAGIANASRLAIGALAFAQAVPKLERDHTRRAALLDTLSGVELTARRVRGDVRAVHDTLSQAVAAEQLQTAQTRATNDARFQSTVTFLTATLLTPTLVGTVYGANVAEFDDGKPGLLDMLVVMFATGLLTYSTLRLLDLKPFTGEAHAGWQRAALSVLGALTVTATVSLAAGLVSGWPYIIAAAALAAATMHAACSNVFPPSHPITAERRD
ncbi:hypothetical protein [Paraconexibacter algicola]|uniref:CorA-like Mg2+ transporter protein n=1 Tax=Paraconexibacter algicola TaxID=2133960 RepID=A0A2T4UI40_9ACTN|nr:hypothetical protein [Paraconexibacter algicola]PTL58887.1 hypothetical protein C7Y72_04075 [Paraconexibacter algicola]